MLVECGIALSGETTFLLLTNYSFLREKKTKNGVIHSVTWSTTERRGIRSFPYPSVFELAGHQRLTVKRGIRNVGQFLAAEVTNPGQNESQHSVNGWIKKGIYWIEIIVRMNRLTGWRKKKEGEWLARTLKTEVAPFSSAEIGIKNLVLRTEVAVNGQANLMPNSGRRSRAGIFRTAVDVIRWIETAAKIPGKSGKNLAQVDNWCLQAKL